LDEPTNHLDMEGIAWLAGHLKARWSASAGGLLIVTHDRWFLDAVCTRMWEVHDGEVEPFEGGYAAYILQRMERRRQQDVAETKRRNILRKELAWLRRGAPARTSKPKFRIDAATQLIADEPAPRDSVDLARLATARLGKDVVDLLHVGVTYPPNAPGGEPFEVLREIEWRIAPGERTGILGPNGVGKSTLLGLVTGDVLPTAGKVKRGVTVRVATLSQQLTELDEFANAKVREVLDLQKTSFMSEGKELSPTQLLERLGFRSSELSTPVRDLSGGQRRRLQLLLVLMGEPNVLILDEPSNDLDTDMLAAMEDLLDTWPGTLLVVSHDRYLIERITDNQYSIEGGTMRHLPGGVEEYLQRQAAGHGAAPSAGGGARPGSAAGGASSADAAAPGADGAAAAQPALAGAERRAAEKELSAIDRRLVKLADEIRASHERIAAHDQSDYTGLGGLTAELEAREAEVARLEDRWLELGELLG
ncbi:MAG: ABC-F family ATP-binding cassette domain-containing protein, partial [Microbacteriaceae bacterium]|nr:ABC-F family ATP-binding cassette domain-containing protein [Microbacteriaceae bacterium]